jgi:hypothetical protein
VTRTSPMDRATRNRDIMRCVEAMDLRGPSLKTSPERSIAHTSPWRAPGPTFLSPEKALSPMRKLGCTSASTSSRTPRTPPAKESHASEAFSEEVTSLKCQLERTKHSLQVMSAKVRLCFLSLCAPPMSHCPAPYALPVWRCCGSQRKGKEP